MKDKKRKASLEEKVVFITNTIGSWVAAAYFLGSDSIVGMFLGIYFVFNFFCFITLVGNHY